jgi:hypothetical protein
MLAIDVNWRGQVLHLNDFAAHPARIGLDKNALQVARGRESCAIVKMRRLRECRSF